MDQGKLSDGTATLDIFNLHSIQESLIATKRRDILFKKRNRIQRTTLPGIKYSIDGTDIYVYHAESEENMVSWDIPPLDLTKVFVRCNISNKIYIVQQDKSSTTGYSYICLCEGDAESLLRKLFPSKFMNYSSYKDTTYVNINKLLDYCDEDTKFKILDAIKLLNSESLIDVSLGGINHER